MRWTDFFGYLGALLTVTTFSMKTMLPLRIAGIVANLAFISYALLASLHPVLLLHLTLLPLNLLRLRELLKLTRQVSAASGAAQSLEWLKPYTRRRSFHAGQTLFRRGDLAGEAYFVLDGGFRAVEAGVAMERGEVIGELGLISTGHRRTQTVVCERDAQTLVINYDEVRQLYFQDPKFGFFFLELAARRLLRDAGLAA